MRFPTRTRVECAVYAVLTSACLTACGSMFQVPPATSPVAPANQTPTTADNSSASGTGPAVSDLTSRPYEPAGEGALDFETLSFERTAVDPEKPLPMQDKYRIRSQADLDAFLDKLDASKTNRPNVDFEHKEVLAFYDKAGGNGCDERKLEKVFMEGDTIKYVYGSENELHPAPDKICTMIYIMPHYDLYAIVKYDAPVQDFKTFTR